MISSIPTLVGLQDGRFGSAVRKSLTLAGRSAAPAILRFGLRATPLLGLSFSLIGPSIAGSVSMADNYARANAIRTFDNRTIGGTIFPHWLPDGRQFYFQSFANHEAAGTVFLVDPVAKSRKALFRISDLAVALSKASSSKINSSNLPVWRLASESKLSARIGGTDYECNTAPISCRLAKSPPAGSVPDWAVRSPDGKWDAFVWNYNLYIRPSSEAMVEGSGYRPLASGLNGNNFFPLSDGSPDVGWLRVTGQREGCDYPAPAGAVTPDLGTAAPVPTGAI